MRSSSPPPRHNPLITGQGTVAGSLLIVKNPCAGHGLHLVVHGLRYAELRVTAGLALLHILDFINVYLCGMSMLVKAIS